VDLPLSNLCCVTILSQVYRGIIHRVPTPPGKSWKALDFFLENSRTWKVLENHFGPGKSWKLKLKVVESLGKVNQTPCAVQPKKKVMN